MLVLDLKVFQRKAHEIKIKEALAWSAVWIALALTFNVGVYFWQGKVTAMEFLAGYLIEKSLSVDNLFVFLLIFSYFRVPAKYQHPILFWGILGALVMRGLFIWIGTSLVQFKLVIVLFGAFLVYTGIKLCFQSEPDVHPEKSRVIRFVRRFVPLVSDFGNGKFVVQRDGKKFATMMFLVLVFVETTDVIFAVDSIPAILAITHDPFIVFTSNVFAILGLRALYFALAGLMKIFHYLNYGLAFILTFVGIKMLISFKVHVPISLALGVIAGVLLLSIAASLIWPKEEEEMKEVAKEMQHQGKVKGEG
jgi:tellurite resistance protein TerC